MVRVALIVADTSSSSSSPPPPPPGTVSVAGENVQLAPTGRLAQANENSLFLALLFGSMASEKVADCPGAMLAALGDAISGPAEEVCCGALFIAKPKTVLADVPELNLASWFPESTSKRTMSEVQ